METKCRIRHYQESPRAFSGHRSKSTVELIGTPGLQELKLHSHRPGRDLFYRERVGRIARVREDRHTADLGNSLLEQLQPFAESRHLDAKGQPGDVPAWAREACDEAKPRITSRCCDNGDRARRVLGCHSCRARASQNDVNLETDKLSREIGESLRSTFCPAILDENTLALNPPDLPQP